MAGGAAPRVGRRESAQITLAGAAATRVLPTAGVGGLALTLWTLRRAGLCHGLAIDAGRSLDRVEPRHRIVDRRRSEDDRDRIRLALLVDCAEVIAERGGRFAPRVLRDRLLPFRQELLRTERRGLCLQRRETSARTRELCVQRIQREQRSV